VFNVRYPSRSSEFKLQLAAREPTQAKA